MKISFGVTLANMSRPWPRIKLGEGVHDAPQARTPLEIANFIESWKISFFIRKVLKFFRMDCPTRFFALIANMASDSSYDLGKIETT